MLNCFNLIYFFHGMLLQFIELILTLDTGFLGKGDYLKHLDVSGIDGLLINPDWPLVTS